MKSPLLLLALFGLSLSATTIPLKVYDHAEIAAGKTGPRSLFAGGKLSGALSAGTFSDGTPCAVWSVTGEPGKGSWACLGFQFQSPTRTVPVGFRLDAELPQETTLSFESRINTDPGKGFWRSRKNGLLRISLPPGRRILEKTWAELKVPAEEWAAVNAVVLSAEEHRQLKIRNFELLYPAETNVKSSQNVNWFSADQNRINPVARPFDKLTSVFCCQSKGFQSILGEAPHPVTGAAAPCWSVEAPENAKGWALYGFGFADRVEPAPAGLCFDVTLTQPTTLTIQPAANFNARRTKGFYSAKNAGKARRFTLPAGSQKINLIWSEFDLAPKEAQQVNSVKFSGMAPGGKMFFDRIDLVFANSDDADRYRAVAAQRLNCLQQVLIDALSARGVNWQKTLAELDADATEPLLWTGLQLAAQREQLDYFQKLTAAESLRPLAERRNQLVKRGEAGDFATLKPETEQLQTELDQALDAILAKLPKEKRRFRYDIAARLFRYPDGRPFRMFGPHFFRSQYRPGPQEWRKWDLRYLAGLGFNGIRVQIRWAQLEPERGTFNRDYLDSIRKILTEAERYGFGVSIDLHWAYPQWFEKGKPGYEVSAAASKHNSYHWPEALIDTWRRLGRELAPCPNIVAFEVPTNETGICAGTGGLTDMPYLMKLWNDFLKENYRTRENLNQVWSAAGEQYGLKPRENWDDYTILPMGFQSDSTVDEAYTRNPRVYDHLRFTAQMQRRLSGDIVKALRESIPDAYGMFQRTIGDVWDKSAVPLNYLAIITCVGEHVIPGTHYGMGSLSARKAATLSLGSYDSEQQMEGNRRAVERHLALGLGLCPFAFHYRGGGGMLLADDDWHLKPEVGYLPLMADAIRNTPPPQPPAGPGVAVIVNSRLEATGARLIGDLSTALEQQGLQVGVFESLRIVEEPELLDSYQLVITAGSYLDLQLLEILRKFPGRTLLLGRLDIDAYARNQAAGLPAYLVKNRLFLNHLPVQNAGTLAGVIDLTGSWEFVFRPSESATPSTPQGITTFESLNVPGMWGEIGLTGSLTYRIGDGWYRKNVTPPAAWRGRPLHLQIGAIDDVDWAFWNGTLIGRTGEETPNHWQAPRDYTIAPELIRYDRPNELYLCVRNLRGNGGIAKGPVTLSAQTPVRLRFADAEVAAHSSGSATLLTRSGLAKGAEVVAAFGIPGHAEEYIGVLRQGNLFWYFKDLPFDTTVEADRKVLQTVLEKIEPNPKMKR